MFIAWQRWPRKAASTVGFAKRAEKPRRRSYLQCLEQLEDRCLPSTFTVLNTNDDGSGSLRQAILNANANSGADVIQFNVVGSGVHTIAPTSPLPAITDAVTVQAARRQLRRFGSTAPRPDTPAAW